MSVWDCFRTNLYRIYWDFSSVSLCVSQFLDVLNTSPGLGDSANPCYVHTQLWRVPRGSVWFCTGSGTGVVGKSCWPELCVYLQRCFPVEVCQKFLPCLALMVFLSTWTERGNEAEETCPWLVLQALWRHPESVLYLFWAQQEFETFKHRSSRNPASKSSWGHLSCFPK